MSLHLVESRANGFQLFRLRPEQQPDVADAALTPAHTFTYAPIDFTSSYVPPTVSGTGPTGYLFNVDPQPTEVQRPDGHTTTFAYGATNGRLNAVTFSSVAIAAFAGLADAVTQLVLAIGCPDARPNVGSVVGSIGAATITAGCGARVPILAGFKTAAPFVQELAEAAMGLPTAIIPIVGGALDPFQNREP